MSMKDYLEIKKIGNDPRAPRYFDPEDFDEICNYLTERHGWSREEAEAVAFWSQDTLWEIDARTDIAVYEEKYKTSNPDFEIWLVLQ